MVVENPENKSLEFSDPVSLLFLVVVFMLYSLGFIDLIGHQSGSPVVFGLYSIPFFILLLIYAAGFLVLGILFFRKQSLERLKDLLAHIQDSTTLAVGFLTLSTLSILLIFWDIDRWRNFPILRLNLLAFTMLILGIAIFSGWRQRASAQPWRRVTVIVLIVLFVVEGVLQALSWTGNLPGFVQTIDAPFVSYGRMYNTQENLTNGMRNRNGLYFPEFRFEPDARRILLTGDTFIQALSIEPEQHLGVLLDEKISSVDPAGPATEVFELGLPGYGPGIYLDVPLFPFTLDYFKPQELVIVFNLGQDFKPLINPDPDQPRYILNEQGRVRINPTTIGNLHTLQHNVLHAYEPIQPILVIKSHYLTSKVLKALLDQVIDRSGSDLRDPDVPGINSVVFEKAPSAEQDKAYEIAFGLLDQLYGLGAFEDLTIRLVTIPVFPENFFDWYQGSDWDTEMGEFDLLLPEKELQAFAEERGIPYLPMGHYMQSKNLSVDEIRGLFFSKGQGLLTSQGHAFFAEAMFDCFYDLEGSPNTQGADEPCLDD